VCVQIGYCELIGAASAGTCTGRGNTSGQCRSRGVLLVMLVDQACGRKVVRMCEQVVSRLLQHKGNSTASAAGKTPSPEISN
jgi:phage-related protein